MAALLDRKNAGVSQRDARDRQDVKARAALENRSALPCQGPRRCCLIGVTCGLCPQWACLQQHCAHMPHGAPASQSNPASLLCGSLQLQTASDRLGESRAALERKAALYERLARGEVDDEGECCRLCSWQAGGYCSGMALALVGRCL